MPAEPLLSGAEGERDLDPLPAFRFTFSLRANSFSSTRRASLPVERDEARRDIGELEPLLNCPNCDSEPSSHILESGTLVDHGFKGP
jgi:hypothetical protein